MDPDDESLRLRTALRDLVALSTIPAAWVGREPPTIAAGLADVLVGSLLLDFAFVRLCDPNGGAAVDVTRGNAWKAFPEWLERHLAAVGRRSRTEIIRDVGGGMEVCHGFLIPIGVNADGGLVAVACDRPEFPSETDQMLLTVAANHAATAFQSARLINQRRRAEGELRQSRDELEIRVAERTAELSRSEAYLAKAQRLSLTGSFGWQVSSGEIFWSEETFRIFQYDRTATPTLELVLQRVHSEDAAAVKQTIESASQDGKDFDLEHRLVMPDGFVKHVHVVAHALSDDSGGIEFVGAVMDVTEQRQAKAALEKAFEEIKKSEDRLQTVIDTIPGMVWSGRPDGSFDFVNEPWLTYLGCSWEELSAQGGLRSVVHPDDLVGSDDRWSTTRATGKHTDHELRMRRADGQYRWFLTRALPLRDERGNIVKWYGTATDIEDRKQAETELKRAYNSFADAQQLSKTGSFIADLLADDHNWSDEAYRIFEFDPGTKVTVERIREIIHPEDLPVFESVIERGMSGGNVNFEFRIVTSRGEVKHIHAVAHVTELIDDRPIFVGAIRDVTESMVAEGALRESEQQFRTIFDEAGTGITLVDLKMGEPIRNNRALQKMLGCSEEELSRFETYDRLTHPDNRKADSATFRELCEGKRDSVNIEKHFIVNGGRSVWANVVFTLLRDDDGQPRYIIAIHEDITELKRAEGALRRSENYLAEAQKLTHAGSWAYNTLTGELVHSSEEFLRLFGFDPEKGIPSFDELVSHVHAEDRTRVLSEFEVAISSGKDFDLHYRIVHPDGAIRYAYGTGHPVFNQSGEVHEFIGMAMDVTERRRAEEALRRSEHYLAEAQRLSHTGSWALSASSKTAVYWSEEDFRIWGFDPQQGLPDLEKVFKRIHPDDVGRVDEKSRKALREKTEYTDEFRIVLSDGEVRHIHALAHPVFGANEEIAEYVGTHVDVTERKRAEEAVREQARLLNLTHDTIFVRGMDDTIKYWNRGAEELYGWKKEEAIGQISHRLMHTVFPAPLEEIVEELKSAGRWEGVIMHTKRDGTQVTVASRWSLQRDERGMPRAILETNNDITERKRAEEEQKRSVDALRRAQEDLAHVSRVTTMGELTASLAHEVNQPITAAVTNAKTCLRWLDRDEPDLKEARAAAARIVKDGTRAADIISRIRLLFKKGSPERELVDINEVIREMIVLLRGEVTRRSTSVRTELAADLPQVMADRVQLQQVFMNLILNGIDAMKDMTDGGELTIKSQQADDGQLLITVSDTGVGLPSQHADGIFKAFFTTKAEGTGMGLSISRSIVEAHDGRLWASDNSPRGASFHFTLPTVVEEAE